MCHMSIALQHSWVRQCHAFPPLKDSLQNHSGPLLCSRKISTRDREAWVSSIENAESSLHNMYLLLCDRPQADTAADNRANGHDADGAR